MTTVQNPAATRNTTPVTVGDIVIGGNSPIVVQSMTNTDTADVQGTINQCYELYQAGSELVRVTVNSKEAAAAIPRIRDGLVEKGWDKPVLVGDFHYIGHQLLNAYPECAEALAKYRINPGNVGFKKKHDSNFSQIIEVALKHDKPVRIGVNWGSLDPDLSQHLMDENLKRERPLSSEAVMQEALVQSALLSAELAEKIGMNSDKIILSCKTSQVQSLVNVYEALDKRSNYPLHLGLTEAGMGSKGVAATAAAFAILLSKGIGDTIRASLTPAPGGDRTEEVRVCQEILQSLGLRAFIPMVTACPGCGRTTSTVFQSLAQRVQNHIRERMPTWKQHHPGVENMRVAVMGCVVNGPGESKHADIGISLPGTGEEPACPVFIDGEKAMVLRGARVADEFIDLLEGYVSQRYTTG